MRTTPCSLGPVITPDLRSPRRVTLSPHPTITLALSQAPLTPTIHLASHTYGQVTIGALILGTTSNQGNYKEDVALYHVILFHF